MNPSQVRLTGFGLHQSEDLQDFTHYETSDPPFTLVPQLIVRQFMVGVHV